MGPQIEEAERLATDVVVRRARRVEAVSLTRRHGGAEESAEFLSESVRFWALPLLSVPERPADVGPQNDRGSGETGD